MSEESEQNVMAHGYRQRGLGTVRNTTWARCEDEGGDGSGEDLTN